MRKSKYYITIDSNIEEQLVDLHPKIKKILLGYLLANNTPLDLSDNTISEIAGMKTRSFKKWKNEAQLIGILHVTRLNAHSFHVAIGEDASDRAYGYELNKSLVSKSLENVLEGSLIQSATFEKNSPLIQSATFPKKPSKGIANGIDEGWLPF